MGTVADESITNVMVPSRRLKQVSLNPFGVWGLKLKVSGLRSRLWIEPQLTYPFIAACCYIPQVLGTACPTSKACRESACRKPGKSVTNSNNTSNNSNTSNNQNSKKILVIAIVLI